LTANEEFIKLKDVRKGLNITSMLEFLYQKNSNLLDFMGFEVNENILNTESYQEHLEVSAAVDGVRQGKYF
jgi:hypothetical protein